MMKDFMTGMSNRVMVYDGSKGYILQQMGLKGGECPELWNIKHSGKVSEIYRMYKDAGSDVIQTNTFQGNRIQLEKYGLGKKVYRLNYQGACLAKEIMGEDGHVAGSIGPTGILFEPSGKLDFNLAYDVYAEQVKALVDGGADLINFETFTDIAEMRAALIACKETTGKPVICSMAYEENGRTLMGNEPLTAAITLRHLGAEITGTNCSFGPEKHVGIVEQIKRAGDILICVKPNAGIPQVEGDNVVYNETPGDFCRHIEEYVSNGARLIGGCCGTTPDFIKEIGKMIKNTKISHPGPAIEQIITSSTKHAAVNDDISTNDFIKKISKKDLKAIQSGNNDILIDYAVDMSSEGHDAICFDMTGVSKSNNLLAKMVKNTQGYLKEPFIFRTSDTSDLDNTLRIYNGRAGIVVDGFKKDVYERLLDLAHKYGSLLVKSKFMEKK